MGVDRWTRSSRVPLAVQRIDGHDLDAILDAFAGLAPIRTARRR